MREVYDVESRIMKQMTLTIKDGKLARMQEHKERLAKAKPNSIAVKRPDLLDEWDWNKNDQLGIDPYQLTCGMQTQVNWICKKHGVEFVSRARTRAVLNGGCPQCKREKISASNRKAKQGESLADKKPDLIVEWDNEKNEYRPDEIKPSSHYDANWICPDCGNRYSMKVYNRTNGYGCNKCANKKISAARSAPKKGASLADLYPSIAEEWHPTLNGDVLPSAVAPHSSTKRWWLCPVCGEKWECTPASRVDQNTTCSNCNTWRHTSFSEKAVLYYLDMALEVVKENQRNIIPSHPKREIDIWIPEYSIAIEYDGGKWHKNVSRDVEKDNQLVEAGIKVFRIRDNKCPNYNGPAFVINRYGDSDYTSLDKAIEELFAALGIKDAVTIDTRADSQNIYLMCRNNGLKQTLASEFPKIASEWDYNLNGDLTPDMVAPHSKIEVWWTCPTCSKPYKSTVMNRTLGNVYHINCRECYALSVSKRRRNAPVKVSLAEKFPEIAAEWDYEKNGDITPEDVAYSSHDVFNWICPRCGKRWAQQLDKRARTGKPLCGSCRISISRSTPKENESFGDKYPELAKEWNAELNGGQK